MNAERLLEVYEQISEAPDAIARLRRFVLDLAVRGKLVEQDAADEPASDLLERIASKKVRLLKAGGIRKSRKETEVSDENPYRLPSSWTWVPFGDVHHLVRGVTYSKADVSETASPGFVPILRANNIASTLTHDDPVYVKSAKVKTDQYLRKGDYMIALSSGSKNLVGKAALVPDDLNEAFGGFCGAIRLFEPSLVGFVGVFLSSDLYRESISAGSRGIGINNLKKEVLSNLHFPLPPFAEQHRIVAKVDELLALCDRLKEARKTREKLRDKLTAASLARLTAPDTTAEDLPTHAAFALKALPALTTRPDQIKTLRQTILNLAVRGKLVEQDTADEPAAASLAKIAEARDADASRKSKRARGLPPVSDSEASELPPGWESVRLSDIAISMRYGTSTKCGADTALVPVLRIPNVSSGKVTLDDMKFGPLNEREHADLALAAGDLLMIRSNGSLDIVGRSAVVTSEAHGMAFAGYLVRLRTAIEQVNTTYVWMAMNSQLIRDQIEKPIRSAVGLKNVNLTEFGNLAFWLPPLAEQHRIVAKVDALMALCDRLESALSTTDTTRTRLLEALLHEALEPATTALEAAE
ncbi:restriction endonuclease subunit S [Sulfitobacter sp. M21595]|uniref:restriction endonuclease subunit S n=1 Tax=Sulfitobacter sp. M21595 TaxID=3368574 RepID=UPI003746376A